jgi:quercetin dioxygenase-like cupin family protein
MQIYTHLFEQTIKQGERFDPPSGHNAIWVQSGALNDGSNLWNAGDGFYAGSQPIASRSPITSMLCFNFSRSAEDTSVHRTLLRSNCMWADPKCILRLDSVTFPKGAIAYRHVHAGAGTRYLVQGGLEIKSDHSVEHMVKGDAWFEDANSPVKAIAIDTQISKFIRALILPIEFEGKPTIKFLNSEDFDKPKEQTNHRFLDQRITL